MPRWNHPARRHEKVVVNPADILSQRMRELYDIVEKRKQITDVDLRLVFNKPDYERTARAVKTKWPELIKCKRGYWELIKEVPTVNEETFVSNSTNQVQLMQEPFQITEDWELKL